MSTCGCNWRMKRSWPSVPSTLPPPLLSTKFVERHAAVMREPKGEMRRVGKRVQQPKIRFGAADFKNAFAGEREIRRGRDCCK